MINCVTCRKVEDALERIINWQHFGFVKWAHNSSFIEIQKHPGAPNDVKSPFVVVNRACDLPVSILKLADKVDPPKPKERDWRSGDLVMLTATPYQQLQNDTPYELDAYMSFGATWRLKRHGNHFYSKRDFRNLTIEAEQAEGGEKC